jgi:hypothetical protein
MPNEYNSAYAPMQSNAQYGQPQVMGQGSQEAMHQAMLNQQQQFNNQAAQTAASGNPMGSLAGGAMRGLMLAQALRGGTGQNSVELPKIDPQMTGVAGMGDSTGTGVTYGGVNFGQINPYSTGGYGLK